MRLYLVRHAHAHDAADDWSRPLSARGIDTLRKVSRVLKRSTEFSPSLLWHSPLRRAQETAQVLIDELGLNCPVEEHTELVPECDPLETLQTLANARHVDSVALIGHEPHLSSLASLLVRGTTYPTVVEMKKAAVLALDQDPWAPGPTSTRWKVAWLLPPILLGGD